MNANKKRLLIIGAGIEQIKAYQIANKSGLEVIGTDMNPNAPAFKYADDKIVASTRNIEDTVKAVKQFHVNKPIHGVMTIANDVPLTVAKVAEELDLPSISVDTAKTASNKLKMKDVFLENNVPTADYQRVMKKEDIYEFIKRFDFPVVLKPIDGRGARGVLRITEDVDIEWAFDESIKNSEEKMLMVERFVNGRQISTESFMLKGECFTPAYSDRNYEYLERFAPYIIENGGTMPAELLDVQKQEINSVIKKAALAMGIKDGPVKGDIVIENGHPKIIELAARLSGGYFCTDQIPLSNGVDLVTQTIKFALGEEINTNDLMPKYNYHVAIRFLFSESGEIRKIHGRKFLSESYFVKKYAFYKKEGDIQNDIKSHPDRAGFYICLGNEREEVLNYVQQIESDVRIDVV